MSEIVDQMNGVEEDDAPSPKAAAADADVDEVLKLLPTLVANGRWDKLEEAGLALVGYARKQRGRYDA